MVCRARGDEPGAMTHPRDTAKTAIPATVFRPTMAVRDLSPTFGPVGRARAAGFDRTAAPDRTAPLPNLAKPVYIPRI